MRAISALVVVLLMLVFVSGCNKANGKSNEKYIEKVACHVTGRQLPEIHTGFRNFWIYTDGTEIHYANGEVYEYSIAIQCMYSKILRKVDK
jgi:hypothetical protein